jgi:hypothetical protein
MGDNPLIIVQKWVDFHQSLIWDWLVHEAFKGIMKVGMTFAYKG